MKGKYARIGTWRQFRAQQEYGPLGTKHPDAIRTRQLQPQKTQSSPSVVVVKTLTAGPRLVFVSR